MDPLSMIVRIGSLCSVAVKLIVTVSEFIDEAKQAPKEVQALNNELASLYAGLGHIKMAVQAPRISQIPPSWKDDFDHLTKDCGETLAEVDIVVKKAKRTETTGSAKQMLKTVKFVFKAKQVEFLRRRIVSQNGILQILLATLTETRGGHVEQRLEDIHSKVEELLSSRQGIKEILVVLEKEDSEHQAEFTLSDRTKRSSPAQDDSTQGEGASQFGTSPAPAAIPPPPPAATQASPAMDWLKSASGQEAINGALSQAFGGLGQQMLAATSSDIVERVFAATMPTDDVLRAIEMIENKIWPLARWQTRKSKTAPWEEHTPQQHKSSALSVRLSLAADDTELHDERLGDGATRIPGLGGCWGDGSFLLSGKTVSDDLPSYVTPETANNWTWQEYTFQTVQDARDFYFCTTVIVAHIQRARKITTVVFNNIRGVGLIYDSVGTDRAAFGGRFTTRSPCVVM